MATIKDIAHLSGVAPSTVSHVLNGTKHVKSETAERIRQTIHQMNYTPNQLARSLKTNRTNIIGVILPNIGNPFFTGIVEALEAVLSREGYHIVLCCTHDSPVSEAESVKLMVDRGVDGLVAICPGPQFDLSEAVKRNVPAISVDHRAAQARHTVLADNRMGGFLATDCLCRRGRSRVLLITDIVITDPFFERMAGYRNALAAHGILYDQNLVFESPVSYQDGYRAMEQIFERGVDFDSVFSASYYLTMGIMRSLAERNLRVGEDIAIVSYDDPDAASFTIPALTAIRQPLNEMGTLAGELLLKEIRHEPPSEHVHTIKPALIERESA
jgi:LacI family transcriptional regulator